MEQTSASTTQAITPRIFVGSTGITITTGTTPDTAHGGYINGKRILGPIANVDGTGAMGYELEGGQTVGPAGSEYNQFMADEAQPADDRFPCADGSPPTNQPKAIVIEASAAAATPAPDESQHVEQASATTPAVTDAAAAQPAPGDQSETHVIVHNDSVGILRTLINDLEAGVEGAEHEVVAFFRHVFHHDSTTSAPTA